MDGTRKTHDGRLEGKAEGKRKNVPVLLLAPHVLQTVVGVQEHDKPRLLEGSPYGLEGGIVEALAKPTRPPDNASQVGKGRDLLNGAQERLGRRLWDEGEEAEAI